ncbi:transglycosylase SLT domain-containing protein [Nocardia thailandica]|uniref:Transglycosylase SLT domain-containing protein n=1 Tax=Nocardia thailandica TaxID=257275 RepID=A0ABW6PLK8_9NOCA
MSDSDTRTIKFFGRRTVREAVTIAAASTAIISVFSAGVVALADNTVDSGVTLAAAEQRTVAAAEVPAVGAPQAAPAAAPVAEAIPAPAPAPEPAPAPMPAPAPQYPDNLDGWIREALDILNAKGIPASYDGIYRNIMRESTGNPQAINLWDSNAAMGIPSKGLLQVIDPTFAAYHVEGTPFDIWNPVSNIAAACNYAAHRYGSMDNVNSAY